MERAVVPRVVNIASNNTGGAIWYRLTPEAFKAVISLSLERRLKVSNTDNRVAIGMVRTRKEGRRK
jgi:hypothetical protein